MKRRLGTVYLLHFARPFKHARHYMGYAEDGNLEQRLAQHGSPSGANLMRHVAAAGIDWEVARTWRGDRHRERQLKVQGGHSRKCPCCGVTPRSCPWPESSIDNGGPDNSVRSLEVSPDAEFPQVLWGSWP